jgi:4,5:9,10-diseco-3-hydroxy-5,9,17-trioxoandrosta-1(10),2-diene-4-oate hydrolase
MKSLTEHLTFEIPARMGFVNITPRDAEIVARSGVREGLVLCNAGGLAQVDPLARLVILRLAAMFAAGAHGAAWYPAVFRWYYRRLVLPSSAAAARREEIILAARDLAPLLADAWRGFAEPDADLRACAARLTVPTWCAWARSDRLVSYARARAAIRRIPRATATLFRGGHAAFLEDPDRFATAFCAFASAIAPTAASQAEVRPMKALEARP